jgi:hypothetical protein
MVRHGSTWFDKLTNRLPTAHQPLTNKLPKLECPNRFKNLAGLVSGIIEFSFLSILNLIFIP